MGGSPSGKGYGKWGKGRGSGGKGKEDPETRHSRRVMNAVTDEIAQGNNDGPSPAVEIAQLMREGARAPRKRRLNELSDPEIEALKKWRRAVAAQPFIIAGIEAEESEDFVDQVLNSDDVVGPVQIQERQIVLPDPMVEKLQTQNESLLKQLNVQSEQLRIQGNMLQNMMMSVPSTRCMVSPERIVEAAAKLAPENAGKDQIPEIDHSQQVQPSTSMLPLPPSPLLVPNTEQATTDDLDKEKKGCMPAPPTPDNRNVREVSPRRELKSGGSAVLPGNAADEKLKPNSFAFDKDGEFAESIFKRGKKLCTSMKPPLNDTIIGNIAVQFMGILRCAEAGLACEDQEFSPKTFLCAIARVMEREKHEGGSVQVSGNGDDEAQIQAHKNKPDCARFERCFRAAYSLNPETSPNGDHKKIRGVMRAILDAYWNKVEILNSKMSFLPQFFT